MASQSTAQERLRCLHVSEARAAEASGAAHPVQVESGTADGVNTAHLKAFNTGLQAGGRFAQQDVGQRSRSSALEATKHSAHTVQLCEDEQRRTRGVLMLKCKLQCALPRLSS